MTRHLLAAASLAAALAFADAAHAHGSLGAERENDLRAMAEQSNLIVAAEIAGLEYRNTPIKGENGAVPTTLVTLKVSQVLRGKLPQGPLTLRFIGGPDGRGGIASFSGVPMFREGETNILFIKANGDTVCPLTNCEWGRFRVLNGAVYNTHGSPAFAVDKGHVIASGPPPKELSTFRFPAPTFEAVMQHDFVKKRLAEMGISPQQAKARYEQEAPKFIEYGVVHPPQAESAEPQDEALPPNLKGAGGAAIPGVPAILKAAPVAVRKTPAQPMSVKAFLAEVGKIAKAVKRAPAPVTSASLAADYALPPIGKAAPPVSQASAPSLYPAADEEAADPLRKPTQQKK